MNKKTTILIIGTLLFLGLFSELLNYFDITRFNYFVQLAIAVGRLSALILIIRQGTLIKARPYLQYMLLFIGITIIGGLFKILHWPYNNIILLAGLLGIPTVYAFRFIKKQSKKPLDILKFLWATILFVGTIFKIEHWPYWWELLTIEGLLFLIMFIDFSYQELWTDKQAEENKTYC